MSDAPFVTGAKAETQQRDWNRLREAIRNRAEHDEIERLWDKCERWVVTISAPITPAEAAKVPEVAVLIEALTAIVYMGHDAPATFAGTDLDWANRRAAQMQADARAALRALAGDQP